MSIITDLIAKVDDFATRAGTEFKAIRTLISGSGTGDVSGLSTTADNLVDAINEIFAGGGSGGVAVLNDLTDVVISSVATGHMIRYDGAHFVNVDPTTYLQPKDAQLDVWAGIDLDTDGTLAADSDTKVASQKAVRAYFGAQIAALNVQVFKGTIDCSANPNYPAANAGDTYVVSVAGKIGGAAGVTVEAGDLLLCLVDATAAGNHATVGANWDVLQMNLVGAVTGPAASTSGNLPTFNGTSGKVIQDSGVAVSTDGSMAANSDSKVPTEQAVRTYVGAVGSHSFVDVFEAALT